MEKIQERKRARRRNDAKAALLRRRLAVLSLTGFAAFFVLSAQHAVGTAKRHVAAVRSTRVAARQTPSYFDEKQDGFAFEDNDPAAAPAAGVDPQPATSTPPVAQTSVS